jgi:penicillin-binding protein 1A
MQRIIAYFRQLDFNDFRQIFRLTQVLLWSFIGVIVLFLLAVNAGLLGEMPDLEAIQNPSNAQTTTIFSADLEVLGYYYTENRIEVEYKELSPYLIKALVATEDKRFYSHSGIDLKSLFRAVILTGFLRQNEGGGSTLTQQLAKNLFHNDFSRAGRLERMSQKLKEWLLAARIEKTFTKEEIINLYFNTVWFGYNSYGIKTASHTYFYKKPGQLNPEEAAMLVGMLNAPARYNPRLNPEDAQIRRNLVMRRMTEAGAITQKEYDSLAMLPVKLNFHNPDYREGLATYLREQIRQDLKKWCAQHKKEDGTSWDIYQDGLRIYTTIDSRMQQIAEDAVKEQLTWLQAAYFKEWKGKMSWKSGGRANPELLEKTIRKTPRYLELMEEGKSDADIMRLLQTKERMTVYSPSGPIDTVMSLIDSVKYSLQMIQVGVLAVDARNGQVKAWIGGPNIRFTQLDHVRKSTRRQVGSTFKPLQYAVALERNYVPCTPIPYTIPEFDGQKIWDPAGTDKWGEGDMVPMQDGLAFSDNRITAQLMAQFGPEALVDMAKRLQIESPLDPVPALCLGASDVSLYEMVGAYTAFANLGTYSRPYYISRIEDSKGNVLARFGPDQKEALSETVAWTTTQMLKGVVQKGTATRLTSRYGINFPVAGKTGTTQNNSDAWFIAYTPAVVIGCWVGFDQPSVHFASNSTGQGSTAALPIVGSILSRSARNSAIGISGADFAFPADSTFQVVFDCTAVPAAGDSSLANP